MGTQTKLTDYDGFVEKFERKKTTDDCYTPPEIYDAVLQYAERMVIRTEQYDLMRPFWPGGDYEKAKYTKRSVVVDNPPFSIISKIVKFYLENNVKFFLFAPGQTLMNCANYHPKVAYHIINRGIRFENSAIISIGFITNMRPDNERIVIAGELERELQDIQKREKKNLRKLEYPKCVVSGALLKKYVTKAGNQIISDQDCSPIKGKDAPFGGGYIVKDNVIRDLEMNKIIGDDLYKGMQEDKTECRKMSPAFYKEVERLNKEK